MRRMPRLLRDAGLIVQTSFAHVLADIGSADFFAPSIASFVKLRDLPRAAAPGGDVYVVL